MLSQDYTWYIFGADRSYLISSKVLYGKQQVDNRRFIIRLKAKPIEVELIADRTEVTFRFRWSPKNNVNEWTRINPIQVFVGESFNFGQVKDWENENYTHWIFQGKYIQWITPKGKISLQKHPSIKKVRRKLFKV